MKLTYKTLAAAVALSATPAMAADLGGNGGYKDTIETVAPGVSASWSGFYIMGGLGRSSTSHDVKGQEDYSTGKVLSDTNYLTHDVYSYVVTNADGKTETVYSKSCPTGATCTVTPAGTPVDDATKTALTDLDVVQTVHKGAVIPHDGELGDAVWKNGGSTVGYTLDTTSLFTRDGTASGFVGSLGLGYDKQFGSMLIGVMGDYQFRTNKTTIGGVNVKESDAIFLGARLGFLPTHNMLVYVLGGYTWLNHSGLVNSLQTADPFYGAPGYEAKYSDGSFGGFTLGGGAEIPVARNVYLGVEGRHTWYGKEDILSSTYTYADGAYHHDSFHVTDEPTEWYVGATLKLKMNGDSFK